MFTGNPFAELSTFIPSAVAQVYVVVMFLLVVAGTLIDVVHKKSAKYFFEDWQKSKSKGTRQVGSGEVVAMAVQTMASEVLTSSEFCSARRRIAHLLTMYGFVILSRSHHHYGIRVPNPGESDTGTVAAALASRGTDGLYRRLLVLVFHSGRCYG